VRPVAAFVLSVALAALAAGAPGLDTLRAGVGRLAGDASTKCAFRARTGLDCLGCGGTRAFGHVARGRIGAAFRSNILGAAVGLLTWAAALGAASSLWTRRSRYLMIWGAATGLLLPVAFAVHAVLWWHALPAGMTWP